MATATYSRAEQHTRLPATTAVLPFAPSAPTPVSARYVVSYDYNIDNAVGDLRIYDARGTALVCMPWMATATFITQTSTPRRGQTQAL